jgi:drug/metabolite transporter (DMT)-like permease
MLANSAAARRKLHPLQLRDWLMTGWLGFIGYLGFLLTVAGAAIYAGPVIAPAFLSLVPVTLAIAGNLRQRTLSWPRLAVPLTFAAAGLLLVNASGLQQIGTFPARRPKISASVWTALIMVSAGLEVLAFLPIGLWLGVFEIPPLGLSWDGARPLYLWGTALALLSSVGGALAWTIAARRLPVALAAQLVAMETVFGTAFGLIARHQAPTSAELGGMTVLIVGVLAAIRIFHDQRGIASAPP